MKRLTATQKQRLHWEQVKRNAEEQIEEIKEKEDLNDELTAKRIEDVKRWNEQNKQWTLKNLTLTELYQEIKKRKELYQKSFVNCPQFTKQPKK